MKALRRNGIQAILAIAVALVFAACSDDGTSSENPEPQPGPQSIAEIAGADGSFSTLFAAVEAAGLGDTLANDGPFTVFAPTNAAFAALPEGTVEALLADTEALTEILLYHVIAGTYMASDVTAMSSLTTLQGEEVMFEVREDGSVWINEAQITMTDIEASNGVIHVIDAVLLPPEEPQPQTIVDIAAGNEDFSTLVTAVVAAGLDDDLAGEGPFTVFAPTNAAFAALPEGTLEALLADTEALTEILLYHVAAGSYAAADVTGMSTIMTLQGEEISVTVEADGSVHLNEAHVIMTDIMASNGIIHVIDAVLLPPEEPQPQTITEIAASNEDFSTLATAVVAAGLDDDLAGEGPFTVFAPTNAAFAALPEGTIEALLADTEALTEILLYHVVAGEQMASDVIAASSFTTLQGEEISIMVDGSGNAYVNDAMITMTDIMASNGVIHVIDAVLLPPEDPGTIVDIAAADERFSTLVTAVVAAGLDDDLAGEGPFTVFAPTNAAFDALPEGTLESLLANPSVLASVLLYHVVPGTLMASEVVGANALTTLQGEELSISTGMGMEVYVNDATIVITDIEASNGVIHVIDAVVTPPSL